MAGPSWFQRFADRFAVCVHGGARVRVWQADGKALGCVFGGASEVQAERLLQRVLELKPERSGTVDIVNDGRGHMRITVRGPLADENLEQRLRNTLVNL